ncbi:MAG: hypothetical protein CFE45_39195, partial [Burkholderiales bacterium PBB5]
MVLAFLLAQPRPPAQAAARRAQADALMAFYGVRHQYLATLLDADACGQPTPREPLPRLPAVYAADDADDANAGEAAAQATATHAPATGPAHPPAAG